jgi:hypothetical protein
MTDPERDHLLGRISDLERRLRRWRLTSLVLLGLLLLPVVLGGLLGVWWVPRLERERARLEAQRRRAEEAEVKALRYAQTARGESAHQRALAEAERREADRMRKRPEEERREADRMRKLLEEEERRSSK